MPFPDGFLFGAATSSFQIEGSLDADGRGESVWDVFTRTPGAVEGAGDASVACDSYRRWSEDVALVKELGLRAYRFSVGWSRVLPEGRGQVEARGLDHYDRLVDALLAEDVVPVVTLNHWDMPQALMAHQGWVGRESVDAFADYTTAVADRLADRVEWFITQNEPWIITLLGYQLGLHAPGVADLGLSVRAAHHVLLGHGAAADVLHQHPGVRAGCALSLFPHDPASDSDEDAAAARASDGYVNRWYLDPLLGSGYPDDMRAHYERAIGGDLDFVQDGDESAIGRAQRLPRRQLLHPPRRGGRGARTGAALPLAGGRPAGRRASHRRVVGGAPRVADRPPGPPAHRLPGHSAVRHRERRVVRRLAHARRGGPRRTPDRAAP